MSRRLVVNADDFGFTHDVNEGIVEAHRRGILTSTTLMANGAAFEHAVELARANPALDIGCHLVLIGGESLTPPRAALPETVAELIQTLARGRLNVEAELRAQVGRILAAGIRPTHLDRHKHTHLAPPVLAAVARISAEFGIPWVRRTFDLPLLAGQDQVPWPMRAASRVLGALRPRFDRVLSEHGCRTTDYFAGFAVTGRFHTADLVALIESLPEGSTEFMCHPGYCTGELRAARTRLKESRERELEALTAPEAGAALLRAGVDLVNYSGL